MTTKKKTVKSKPVTELGPKPAVEPTPKPKGKAVQSVPCGATTVQDHEERIARIENKLGLDNWDVK